MAFKEGKDYYICDRCGTIYESSRSGGFSDSPRGWKRVNISVEEDGETKINKPFDVCPECAKVYVDLSLEMGRKFFNKED